MLIRDCTALYCTGEVSLERRGIGWDGMVGMRYGEGILSEGCLRDMLICI